MSEGAAYKSVLGGKLGLKTSKLFKKKKGKKRKAEESRSHEEDEGEQGSAGEDGGSKDKGGDNLGADEFLTPAQKKQKEKLDAREAAKMRELVKKTHREKVEEFNHKLSTLTEHNDLPRVSAAGNG
jgi:protein FAM32A